jgi:hypothetical protein
MNNSIKEWLFNLNCLYNNILNALNSHKDLYKYSNQIEESLMNEVDVVFIAYILTFTNSMIDEWNFDVGSEVIAMRKICKPVFKYINEKWPEIKALRNNILAHNHRNKENKSIHFSNKGFNYKVPMDNVEIQLLVTLLGMVIEAVNKTFKFDYDIIAHSLPNELFFYKPMSLEEAEKINFNIRDQMNNLYKNGLA